MWDRPDTFIALWVLHILIVDVLAGVGVALLTATLTLIAAEA